MVILAVPDVVVLKPVDIGVQTVVVHVHVDHENVWGACRDTAVLTKQKETAEYHSGPESPPALYTNL
jgi:hypothetical protein